MRATSYRNVLWILAVLAMSWIPALAQAPPSGAQAQSAVIRVTPPHPQQRQTVNFVTVHYELQNASSSAAGFLKTANPGNQTPLPQAMNPASAQSAAAVQTASVLPDSGSLLPVAGIVGFSFLLGGIVCGAIKRP